ncbi:transcriptional repressor [Fodinisporobacter ferrooxydans]|uniref:Transcriptional repressor n=1 Tax=Fodinisporobacter ferrooxydans TaxID=2901836 RepID=A0ABY4CJS3_9BACL|nr:transcriptional repressor [Alicyclobacillaceae bacterium MYW30-H2]
MELSRDYSIDPVLLLKEYGLRITPQRISILSHMNQYKMHLTAEQIYHAIKDEFPSLSVATVYNTLKAFIDAGFVKELRVGDHASKFDLNLIPHHHLVCEKCGHIEDFHFIDLPIDKIANMHNFHVRHYHLEINGLCANCQEGHPSYIHQNQIS